jgi:hypothetical protein
VVQIHSTRPTILLPYFRNLREYPPFTFEPAPKAVNVRLTTTIIPRPWAYAIGCLAGTD